MFKIIGATTNSFTIKGNHLSKFPTTTPTPHFVVRHSAANNGSYIVTSSSIVGSNTLINVTPAVPSPATVDGAIDILITGIVSGVNGTIKVKGDFSSFIPPTAFFKIFGSTGNDGLYQSLNTVFSLGETTFTVANVPSGVIDGTIISVNDYIINFSDQTKPTLLVGEGTINSQLDVDIPGRGAINHGEVVVENFVHMLESFSSTVSPSSPIEGQLWYDTSTSPKQLKIFDGVSFQLINNADFVLKSGDTMDLNADITFNGGEVLGLPATPSVNDAATSKLYVDTEVGTISSNLSTHTSDASVHITSLQNTFLDALNLPVLTAAEVNYLAGTTSNVQTQLDNKLDKVILSAQTVASQITFSDDLTIGAGKDITLQSGGEIFGLPSTPTLPTSATSKDYVDNLVSSGTTWKDPIIDPDLIDVVTIVPGSPVADTTYIAYGGSYPQVWGSASVNSLDVVWRNTTNTDWVVINSLLAGDRYIIAGEHGTIGGGLSGVGFVNDDLVQYISGDPSLFASWSLPHGRGNGGIGTEILQGITVLVKHQNSAHFGHTYLYDASGNQWIEIAGPGAVGSGGGLYYSANVLNIGTADSGRIVINSDNIDLGITGVSAGSYNTVSVDIYGRVTAGSNPIVSSQWITNVNDIYYTAGNVGVGVTPSNKFHVSGGGTTPTLNGGTMGMFQNNTSTSDPSRITIISGATGFSAIEFGDASSAQQGIIYYSPASDYMYFGTGTGNERVRIDSSGNVGIGTSSILGTLSIKKSTSGPTYVYAIPNTTGGSGFITRNDANSLDLGYFTSNDSQVIVGSNATVPVLFHSAGTEKMRLDINGNLAIGNTGSSQRLLVRKDSSDTGYLSSLNPATQSGAAIFNESITTGAYTALSLVPRNSSAVQQYASLTAISTSSGYAPILAFTRSTSVGSHSESMRIDEAGKVGIGTTTPVEKLEISNAGTCRIFANDTLNVVTAQFGAYVSGGIIGTATNHPLEFRTNDVSRMQITSAGVVNLIDGQLQFPASQNPSANVNTLDDYEEGTFTPVIYGSATAGAGTYTIQSGRYTKIGNMVAITIRVGWSSHTGTGTSMRMSGLPFTNGATDAVLTMLPSSLLGIAGQIPMAQIQASTNFIIFRQYDPGAGTPYNDIAMDVDGTTLIITGTYLV